MVCLMETIKIWVLTGVLATGFSVILVAARIIATRFGAKMDILISSVERLTMVTTQQAEQIKNLYTKEEVNTSRLNDHSVRIRNLESKQASCRNFNTHGTI